MADKPAERARAEIDRLLSVAGWSVQSMRRSNIYALRGMVIHEFPLNIGSGLSDYLVCIDAGAASLIEARIDGTTVTRAEVQSGRYAQCLPDAISA